MTIGFPVVMFCLLACIFYHNRKQPLLFGLFEKGLVVVCRNKTHRRIFWDDIRRICIKKQGKKQPRLLGILIETSTPDFSKDVQKEGINTQFFRRADELCQHVLDSAPDAEKLDMPRITEQQRVVCLVVFVLLIVPAVYVLAVMLAGYLRQHQ